MIPSLSQGIYDQHSQTVLAKASKRKLFIQYHTISQQEYPKDMLLYLHNQLITGIINIKNKQIGVIISLISFVIINVSRQNQRLRQFCFIAICKLLERYRQFTGVQCLLNFLASSFLLLDFYKQKVETHKCKFGTF